MYLFHPLFFLPVSFCYLFRTILIFVNSAAHFSCLCCKYKQRYLECLENAGLSDFLGHSRNGPHWFNPWLQTLEPSAVTVWFLFDKRKVDRRLTWLTIPFPNALFLSFLIWKLEYTFFAYDLGENFDMQFLFV